MATLKLGLEQAVYVKMRHIVKCDSYRKLREMEGSLTARLQTVAHLQAEVELIEERPQPQTASGIYNPVIATISVCALVGVMALMIL